MRLFIAIDCDNKAYFQELQEQLPTQEAKLKLTFTYHITLQFLGEVEEPEPMKKLLETISFKPFTITFDHIGYFTPQRPRVVWVGIKDNEDVMTLQKQVSGVIQPLGFTEDNRFHPHITLARVKFLDNKKEFKDKIGSIKVKQQEVEVNSFTLYKSTLTPEGPIYEPLATYKAEDL